MKDPFKKYKKRFTEGLLKAAKAKKIKEANSVYHGAALGAAIGGVGNALHKGYKAHKAGASLSQSAKAAVHGGAHGAAMGGLAGAGAGLVSPHLTTKAYHTAHGAMQGAGIGAKHGSGAVTSAIPITKRVKK